MAQRDAEAKKRQQFRVGTMAPRSRELAKRRHQVSLSLSLSLS
eukprot:COSAG03_NODE_12416_length_548_cov_1.919822_3_plen_42_part_01